MGWTKPFIVLKGCIERETNCQEQQKYTFCHSDRAIKGWCPSCSVREGSRALFCTHLVLEQLRPLSPWAGRTSLGPSRTLPLPLPHPAFSVSRGPWSTRCSAQSAALISLPTAQGGGQQTNPLERAFPGPELEWRCHNASSIACELILKHLSKQLSPDTFRFMYFKFIAFYMSMCAASRWHRADRASQEQHDFGVWLCSCRSLRPLQRLSHPPAPKGRENCSQRCWDWQQETGSTRNPVKPNSTPVGEVYGGERQREGKYRRRKWSRALWLSCAVGNILCSYF